ncbi:MAG: class I SAM-dependent methyltransferase [Planctomycetaceae bacterium]
MPDYRWNQMELAAEFDASAQHVHPRYLEIQDAIVDLLPFDVGDRFLLVDLGGGSGRLVEKILKRFTQARAVVVDQSAAFLELARQRLAPSRARAHCLLSRLQDDWRSKLPEKPRAIVSMSAIHHLEPAEKRSIYRTCCEALEPQGLLLNGDEVRPESDEEYLALCRQWVAHKNQMIAAGVIPTQMVAALHQWEERNVTRFGEPRKSGDDCHETVAAQLGYYRAAGFRQADVPWQQEMWAVLRGEK